MHYLLRQGLLMNPEFIDSNSLVNKIFTGIPYLHLQALRL